MEDLKNKRIGNLVVIDRYQNKNKWICQCDCGKQITIKQHLLIKEQQKSCGCKCGESIINKKFGSLIVLEKIGSYEYKCLCECGNITVKQKKYLISGETKSCGCLKRNSGRKSKTWKGFGDISSRIWSDINKKAKARRIKVEITIEEAWNLFLEQNKKCALSGLELSLINDKNNFKSKTASLDRKDSSKDYTIDNVQWIHKDINIMKNHYSDRYFIEMCKKVTNNNHENT